MLERLTDPLFPKTISSIDSAGLQIFRQPSVTMPDREMSGFALKTVNNSSNEISGDFHTKPNFPHYCPDRCSEN
jgi:hypothetical protein